MVSLLLTSNLFKTYCIFYGCKITNKKEMNKKTCMKIAKKYENVCECEGCFREGKWKTS